MTRFLALGFGLLLASGCTQSKDMAKDPAPTGSFSLPATEQMNAVTGIRMAADAGSACIVGNGVVDSDAAVHSGVAVVDLAQKKARWTKKIAPPEGTANVYAIACAFQGNHVYVLANADSQRAMANSQGRVYVYKFALNGELLKHAPIPLAMKSRVAIDLFAQGGTLHAVGYGKDEDEKNEYYSMFISTVDEALSFQTKVMKDGSYSQYSAMRAVGNHLHIGGEFLSKTVSKSDLPLDYAISKIKLGGGYLWSTRPKHKFITKSDNIATAIAADGTAHSLSQAGGNTSLITVAATGTAAPAKTYKSAFCKIEAVANGGKRLLAVRESCPGVKRQRALVAIDPAIGAEKQLDALGPDPTFVTSGETHWFGAGASAGKLEFSFGTLE